jgi:NAD(P)-dependent dehydrogenase (short-subunit alcohol dehydrogenase family)
MILDKFRIDDKIAVVTGGTKGIGKAVALALAEAGADIAVVSRKEDQDIESAVLSLGRRCQCSGLCSLKAWRFWPYKVSC